VLAFSLGLIIFWWFKKGFRGAILLISAAAYFIAIGGKELIQIPTIGAVESLFGTTSVGLGLYFGLQTVFLEVGLAYLFALYLARRRGLNATDGVPYGLALAFWENGVLLGLLSIFNLGVTYLILAGGGAEANSVYNQLVAVEPAVFQPPATLLPSVLIGTLERVSSLMAHLAWGMLVVSSAVSGRKRYLAYALPMGLIDALVPFAHLNSELFEAVVFALSVAFLTIAWRSSRSFTAVPTVGIVPRAIGT
jgi:YhfC intramembrane metalloprotease